ncbi:Cation transporter [Cordyceps fumosorosea ARSEF 2679]|uniref:Cation transporter n=1 Tax=Cordyceps fumosorosea (strain ARSEF 2679) TaxID=1081104 RepID=A0A167TMA0_CORFA|nr:Cation transporter [Cordyceps fumosorosea ARSEF 2679]OAA60745.1 Cation transporter [Cordyceps fumosorosea ARSEF 2679]
MGTLASSSSRRRSISRDRGRDACRRRRKPPAAGLNFNFITVHYCYFIVVCLLASGVFWASSSPRGAISYVDCLFVVVSAVTEAGLNTVNLSTMTAWQQAILFLLILCGGTVWVSAWTVAARSFVFGRRLAYARRREAAAAPLETVLAPLDRESSVQDLSGSSSEAELPGPRSASARGGGDPAVGPDQAAAAHRQTTTARDGPGDQRHEPPPPPPPPPPSMAEDGLIGAAARTRVCGCEHRALQLLSVVVPLYLLLWQLLGCLALGAWISRRMPETALANGIAPWWLGVFNGVSAFNNSGMSLLDANMVPFQEAYFVLITMGLMILAGNTAYPIFLRLLLWAGLRLVDAATGAASFRETKRAIRLLLEDPRRVYTNLFPSRLTWWLVFMLVGLNAIDWALFELLNLHNPVVRSIPVGPRVLVGLFQALAVRSGGFYVVPIAQISIGVQFLYVIMMYISVYPVVLTMRRSDVFTESPDDEPSSEAHVVSHAPPPIPDNTLSYPVEKDGVATGHQPHPSSAASPDQATCRGRPSHPATANDEQPMRVPPVLLPSEGGAAPEKRPNYHTRLMSLHRPPPPPTYESHMSFIHRQIQGQLAQDIWWLVLAVLVIVIIESSHFNADPVNHSVFNVIFEVASAYGTVGISVGTPHGAYSFSGTWYVGSKLILCLVMLRGRHRGLPTALDRAIRLPDQHSSCSHLEEKQMVARE